MTNMKKMAKETQASSSDIIAECLEDTKKASLAIMPPPKQLQELVSRTRMDPELKADPKKLSDLELTDKFCKTDSGESFLLFDSGTVVNENKSEKRLIIFGTKTNLKFLVECNELFMDGTFTITPKLFNQMYTIHGKQHFLNKKRIYLKQNNSVRCKIESNCSDMIIHIVFVGFYMCVCSFFSNAFAFIIRCGKNEFLNFIEFLA